MTPNKNPGIQENGTWHNKESGYTHSSVHTVEDLESSRARLLPIIPTMKSLQHSILYLSLLLPAVLGFHTAFQPGRLPQISVGRNRRESVLYVTSTSSSTIQDYTVEVVKGGEADPRVLDVAAFRIRP